MAKVMGLGVAAYCLGMLGLGTAHADGYPPFYGYSPYFGGPRTYFTPDDDVRSASTLSAGLPAFGTRTYYRGGPFWHYKAVGVRRAYHPHRYRRRVVLIRKG